MLTEEIKATDKICQIVFVVVLVYLTTFYTTRVRIKNDILSEWNTDNMKV